MPVVHISGRPQWHLVSMRHSSPGSLAGSTFWDKVGRRRSLCKTGQLNCLVAVTTGITFGCAGLISNLITVKSTGYEPTAAKTIGIYAALLISHGLVNTFGSRFLRLLNNSSIMFHSLGVSAVAIAIVAKAPTHQSAKFVFATFHDGTGPDGDPGWSLRASPAYVAVCGLLFGQYTITGPCRPCYS